MSHKGFKGVYGDPDQIKESSKACVMEFNNCENFYYQATNQDIFLKQDDNIILLFIGRLDNIEDLLKKLIIKAYASDIDLVLKAYQLFGERCMEHFIGDFSFVIFDREGQKLLLAKDQVGVKPLFYLEKSGCLYFATRIADLVSLLQNNEPLNEKYIATELLGYLPEVEDTFYLNIKRLKPAHFIAFDGKETVVEKKYWELTSLNLSQYKTDQEIYELLLETLTEAISCRTRKANRVGCQLSGGMDSSAIAVLLSRMMNKKNLFTYSFVLNDETAKYTESGIDEKETQQEIIDFAGLLPTNHFNIDKFHYKNVFEEFESIQEVYAGFANSNCIWQESMFKLAAEENQIDIMFSGFPGDEGISNGGGMYYFDYIGNLNIIALMDLFIAHPRSTVIKVLKYVMYYFNGTYQTSYKKDKKKQSLLEARSHYNKSIKDSFFKFYPTFRKYQKARMLGPHTCLRIESEGFYADKFGIETVYPLADIRLLQLVYSLPVRLFKPHPYNRPVFRNLCKDILPDKVRLQPKNSGAMTLAFAQYWFENNYKELGDYIIEDRLEMFIDTDQFKKNIKGIEHEGLLMMYLLVHLKEMDFFINHNWIPTK